MAQQSGAGLFISVLLVGKQLSPGADAADRSPTWPKRRSSRSLLLTTRFVLLLLLLFCNLLQTELSRVSIPNPSFTHAPADGIQMK